MQDSNLTNVLQQRIISEGVNQNTCRLFDLDLDLDVPNTKEEELYSAYCKLQKLFEGKSSLKIIAEIQEKVHTLYEEINCGLLYGILTDPLLAPKYLNFLRIAVKNNFKLISEKLLGLVSSYSFKKFGRIPCQQIIWLLDALCESKIMPFNKTLIFLIRQINVCDLSHNSICLATGIVKILNKHREALALQSIELFQLSVYSFLRMILEHSSIPSICKSEVEYVIYQLNNNFSKCIPIGRDLIRALQDVSAIPEFNIFWSKLLYSPQSLSKNITTISDILAIPTPKWIMSSRLTPEMEARLGWILLSVKYVTKFLKFSQHEFIYVDFIRFICVAIHPTNEIIKSNIVQRWDVVLYLIKTIENEMVAQQVKLALFYDFLFWNVNADNIMNIEPTILLIAKCIKVDNGDQMHISSSFIEFLHLIADHYNSVISKNIYISINLAMRELISRGVLRSFKQLYSPKLNKKAWSHLISLFRLFINNEDHLPSVSMIIEYFNNVSSVPRTINTQNSIQQLLSDPQHFEKSTKSAKIIIDVLDIRKTARFALSEMHQDGLSFSRKDLINAIEGLKLLENNPFELTKNIILIFNIFTSIGKSSNFDLELEFSKVFNSFKHELPSSDEFFSTESAWNISPMICLLESCNEIFLTLENPIKFEWSLFLSVFLNPEKTIPTVILFLWTLRYYNMLKSPEVPELLLNALEKSEVHLNTFIFECMEIIQSKSIDLFFSIIDPLFSLFRKETTGNVELINLIIQVMDPANLLNITKKLELSNWRLFGYENLSAVIRYIYKSSSELPEPTQTVLWRLILSEFIENPLDASDLILRLLETGAVLSKSSEAIFAFQQLILHINPDERHVRFILTSKIVDSAFVLKKWIQKFNFSEFIISTIQKAIKIVEMDPYTEIPDPSTLLMAKDMISGFPCVQHISKNG